MLHMSITHSNNWSWHDYISSSESYATLIMKIECADFISTCTYSFINASGILILSSPTSSHLKFKIWTLLEMRKKIINRYQVVAGKYSYFQNAHQYFFCLKFLALIDFPYLRNTKQAILVKIVRGILSHTSQKSELIS